MILHNSVYSGDLLNRHFSIQLQCLTVLTKDNHVRYTNSWLTAVKRSNHILYSLLARMFVLNDRRLSKEIWRLSLL